MRLHIGTGLVGEHGLALQIRRICIAAIKGRMVLAAEPLRGRVACTATRLRRRLPLQKLALQHRLHQRRIGLRRSAARRGSANRTRVVEQHGGVDLHG